MSRELLDRISWDIFPKPYDEELPHYAARAYERLTPEGVVFLDEVIAVAASNPSIPVAGDRPPRPQWQGQGEDRLLERLEALPEWDRDAVLALNKHFMEAFEAAIDRNRGEMDLMKQMLAIHAKAVAIDPDYPRDATAGETVDFLRARGVPVGISDEVLEMLVEIPPEAWEEGRG